MQGGERVWPVAAALFIDYGEDDGGAGDTLQAVRGHAYEHVLMSPGEADLSALVDFGACARAAVQQRYVVDGPVTQTEFLGGLGAIERASRLMAANPAKAGAIEAGLARLLAPQGMGGRFKAIGLRRGIGTPLPGLAEARSS
jgi:NADH dehydrogenase [ubiquinone] 1 alpha subcomplex assembly factor 7